MSYIDEVSNVGGLSDPFLMVGFLISFLFVDPFRKLDLSLQFSRLKSKIIFQEGMTGGKGLRTALTVTLPRNTKGSSIGISMRFGGPIIDCPNSS